VRGRQLSPAEFKVFVRLAAGPLDESQVSLGLARALVRSGRGCRLRTVRKPGEPVSAWVLSRG